jgi:hypothetical protein
MQEMMKGFIFIKACVHLRGVSMSADLSGDSQV